MEYDRKAVMAKVCEQIAIGKSLRSICQQDDVPAISTVQLWLTEDEKLSEQYARAREAQADHYADEIVEIADKATDAALARLQVDARKWVASKFKSKAYGDKVDVTSAGKAIAPTIIELVGVAPDGDRAA